MDICSKMDTDAEKLHTRKNNEAWPAIFTQPKVTHFKEKNRRPDFEKIICVKFQSLVSLNSSVMGIKHFENKNI